MSSVYMPICDKGHEAAGLEASVRHCQHVNEVHKAAGSEASARHYSWPVGNESRFRLRSYFFSYYFWVAVIQ